MGEQTPQVWAHCANVKIVAATTTTSTTPGLTPPTPPPGEGDEDQHMHETWEAFPDHVCRLHAGDTSHDGGGSIDHKGHELDIYTIDACKFQCMQELDCKGVEFHPHTHHCEIWSEPIGFTLQKPGYQCHKLAKKSSKLLLAETNGQPVLAETSRHTWASLHMAIVSGIATAAVLSVAAMAVRRMARSTASQVELYSDQEAAQTPVD